MKTEKEDIYEKITNEIIAALQKGCDSWKRPWHGGNLMPKNALTSAHYRGVNVLVLWIISENLGYSDGLWATYRQWAELGAQVRKGEKGCSVVFWKAVDKKGSNLEAEEESEDRIDRSALFAKTYHVFNASQVDNYNPDVSVLDSSERMEDAERFFQTLGVTLKEAGSAFYRKDEDAVYMPPFGKFVDKEAYYSTLSHEVTHWTGHESRLDRDLSGRFGDESYAMEELVAELGAAFLCSELHVENSPREDHASYIQNWLKVLKEDNRAVFTAASKAQQAVDWLVNVSQSERIAA